MNICKDCKHMRRGQVFHRALYRPPELHDDMQPGGDYICAAHPITPSDVDPQDGSQGLPWGEDCRKLNPTGKCGDFVRAGLLTRLFR